MGALGIRFVWRFCRLPCELRRGGSPGPPWKQIWARKARKSHQKKPGEPPQRTLQGNRPNLRAYKKIAPHYKRPTPRNYNGPAIVKTLQCKVERKNGSSGPDFTLESAPGRKSGWGPLRGPQPPFRPICGPIPERNPAMTSHFSFRFYT